MVCALAATILAAWTSMPSRAQRHASRSVCIGKLPKLFLLMTFTTCVFHVCQNHFMISETRTTRSVLLANRNPCAIFPTFLRVRCANFESSKLGPVQLKTGGPFWNPHFVVFEDIVFVVAQNWGVRFGPQFWALMGPALVTARGDCGTQFRKNICLSKTFNAVDQVR